MKKKIRKLSWEEQNKTKQNNNTQINYFAFIYYTVEMRRLSLRNMDDFYLGTSGMHCAKNKHTGVRSEMLEADLLN